MNNKSIESKIIITITVVSLLFNFYLFKQNYRKHEIIIQEYTDSERINYHLKILLDCDWIRKGLR
ncbi:hypothetical protein Y919_02490 [Caloranaerobacter azorensis H53214]|uniref:Uncharacterized protein n=1 Tax=Caloranaerobacter azorensis H53214 TaxID=1156417 RepID=A0A096DPB9_9FIRM|nr:hypothetical protein [Caloranaerobacter azorensis]KGG81061.1 hypothetical protein Y919_02490 [Caloranaerobacter azorensis H53214]